MGRAPQPVLEAADLLAKMLVHRGGMTQNEIRVWWADDMRRQDFSVLAEAIRVLVENGAATAKNIGSVKYLKPTELIDKGDALVDGSGLSGAPSVPVVSASAPAPTVTESEPPEVQGWLSIKEVAKIYGSTTAAVHQAIDRERLVVFRRRRRKGEGRGAAMVIFVDPKSAETYFDQLKNKKGLSPMRETPPVAPPPAKVVAPPVEVVQPRIKVADISTKTVEEIAAKYGASIGLKTESPPETLSFLPAGARAQLQRLAESGLYGEDEIDVAKTLLLRALRAEVRRGT